MELTKSLENPVHLLQRYGWYDYRRGQECVFADCLRITQTLPGIPVRPLPLDEIDGLKETPLNGIK